jgi:murein DD-endopeptidase MepM/ murein hydrolase activator NlpD
MGARLTLTRATYAAVIASLTAGFTLTGPPAAARQPDSIEDQIATADAELKAAQAQLADTYEVFTAADQRFKDLSAAATTAEGRVVQTSAEAAAATSREQEVRVEFDEFAASSYRYGSTMFSASAYLGSNSPEDLLEKASLLGVIASEHGDVMDTTLAAVEEKTEADQAAQTARDDAVRNRDAAATAKAEAEQAYNTAVATQTEAQAETARLANRRATLVSETGAVSASGPVVLPAQGRLTSTYGARGGSVHFGIDIANTIGTPIRSAMAGEVIDSGPASGFGLWVRVQHANGVITVYGHINESLVRVGQQVSAGQQIATLGNRGQSTGPHLHFEVHEDGNKIDPLPFLRSHGVAI